MREKIWTLTLMIKTKLDLIYLSHNHEDKAVLKELERAFPLRRKQIISGGNRMMVESTEKLWPCLLQNPAVLTQEFRLVTKIEAIVEKQTGIKIINPIKSLKKHYEMFGMD